jgi:excisionase family DNA binding protein
MEPTNTQDESDLVGVSEAAKLANMSIDTIRRYSDQGILKTLRTPKNHRRFHRSDVEALVAPVKPGQADA